MVQKLPAFEELSELSEKINDASDSVNEILNAFEEELKSLNLGVEVWQEALRIEKRRTYNEYGEDTGGIETHTLFGYTKFPNGKWGLAVQDTQYSGDEHLGDCGEPRPLASASRDLRMLAVERLPSLLVDMKTRAKELLISIEKSQSNFNVERICSGCGRALREGDDLMVEDGRYYCIECDTPTENMKENLSIYATDYATDRSRHTDEEKAEILECCQALKNCGDPASDKDCDAIGIPRGSTLGQVALKLSKLITKVQ